MNEVRHLTMAELEAGLPHILAAPADTGEVVMIVMRPDIDARETVQRCELSLEDGLVGDNWKTRGALKRIPRKPEIERQLTLMNARAAALVAVTEDRWPLAGDQFYVDLDLSDANVPAGTQLRMGTAVVEVTEPPHTGCRKFIQRFGKDAMKWVNSESGRRHNLRGVNARVVSEGRVSAGDTIRKL